MSDELIFCTRWPGEQGYEWFWHEADVLLYAVGQVVAAQLITSDQAREIHGGHYDVKDTCEVQPEDIDAEKAAILEDWERYYSSREEVDEYLESAFGAYGNFPKNEELDHLPNSMAFWEDADHRRLEGVGFSADISPASGPVFLAENDDALAESFVATLKTELLYQGRWPTRQDARAAIFEYVEGFYNTRRRHSALGYLSPAEFEEVRLEEEGAA